MAQLANKLFKPEGFLAALFCSKRNRKAVEDYSEKLAQTLRRFERKDQLELQA